MVLTYGHRVISDATDKRIMFVDAMQVEDVLQKMMLRILERLTKEWLFFGTQEFSFNIDCALRVVKLRVDQDSGTTCALVITVNLHNCTHKRP